MWFGYFVDPFIFHWKMSKCVVSEYGYSVAAGVAALSLKVPVVIVLSWKDQTKQIKESFEVIKGYNHPITLIVLLTVKLCDLLGKTSGTSLSLSAEEKFKYGKMLHHSDGQMKVFINVYLLVESDIKLNMINNVDANIKQMMEIFFDGILWKLLSSVMRPLEPWLVSGTVIMIDFSCIWSNLLFRITFSRMMQMQNKS